MVALLYVTLGLIGVATVVVVVALAIPSDRLPRSLSRVRQAADRPDHWIGRPRVNAAVVGLVVAIAVAMSLVHHHRAPLDWLLFGIVPLVLGAAWLVRRVRT